MAFPYWDIFNCKIKPPHKQEVIITIKDGIIKSLIFHGNFSEEEKNEILKLNLVDNSIVYVNAGCDVVIRGT